MSPSERAGAGEADAAILERIKAYRQDLENRIAFLESGRAEVRLKHEG